MENGDSESAEGKMISFWTFSIDVKYYRCLPARRCSPESINISHFLKIDILLIHLLISVNAELNEAQINTAQIQASIKRNPLSAEAFFNDNFLVPHANKRPLHFHLSLHKTKIHAIAQLTTFYKLDDYWNCGRTILQMKIYYNPVLARIRAAAVEKKSNIWDLTYSIICHILRPLRANWERVFSGHRLLSTRAR